jgi:septum formation inhibitor MinC
MQLQLISETPSSASTHDAEPPAVVMVSGRGALVNFTIDDSVPVDVACRELRNYLGRFRDLYANGEVTVDIGRRMLADDQRVRLQKVIESESGLAVRQFWCSPTILEAERQRLNDMLAEQQFVARQYSGPASPDDDPAPDPLAKPGTSVAEGEESPPVNLAELGQPDNPPDPAPDLGVTCAVIQGTWRAGEVLRAPGNVVIMGNVNPGAQVIAVGDILVFGALRGTAHAGADGNAAATIVAMSAANPDLRIGDYRRVSDEPSSSTASNPDPRVKTGPIIAVVRNRALVVSPYLKNHGVNHGVNHGGNLNER